MKRQMLSPETPSWDSHGDRKHRQETHQVNGIRIL